LAVVGNRTMGAWLAGGVVYVALPCTALIWLRDDSDAGRFAIFWLLAVVWGMDIAAYVFGTSLGGPRLAPRISPKKTWAAVIGGPLWSALAGTGVAVAFAGDESRLLAFAAAAAALGVLSQGGDLLESGVKRHFGAKDAGALIPGHGGLLGRVDGLLAAAV